MPASRSFTISLVAHLTVVNLLAKNIAHGVAIPSADTYNTGPGMEQSQAFFDQLSNSPPTRSDRIVFADRPPRLPPWSAVETGNMLAPISDDVTSGSEVTSSTPRGNQIGSDDDQGQRTLAASGGRNAAERSRRSVPLNGIPSSIYHYADLQRVEQHHQRHHRVFHQSAALQPVCSSTSEWVQLSEAEDFLGNRVQLVQGIDNGSGRVNQYIYETRCSASTSGNHHLHQQQQQQHPEQGGGSRARGASSNSCLGIDSTMYHSVCYDTYHLVYGLVAEYSRSGNGWTYIKVRSGCTCGLLDKRVAGGGLIDEGPSRHRSLRGRNYRR